MTKLTASTCPGQALEQGMAESFTQQLVEGLFWAWGGHPTSSDAPNSYSQQGSAKTDLWGLLWKLRASLGRWGAVREGSLSRYYLP